MTFAPANNSGSSLYSDMSVGTYNFLYNNILTSVNKSLFYSNSLTSNAQNQLNSLITKVKFARSATIHTNDAPTYTVEELGVNQFIQRTGDGYISLPNASLCDGQVVYIFNNSSSNLNLYANGIISNGVTVSTFISVDPRARITLISDKYNWIAM
jgi:hypothetical protein